MSTPTTPPEVPPCAECREIKDARYQAMREGDVEEARAWRVAMGRHLWEAHP
ncbi:hypothetical protein [Streptomyces sp. ISL-11]|uniref:hypothetical protein n=1 Tax=Streptomyces sp. ISL-11 TaxID=2819174 RepID=UPI001BECE85D|nr:hypothetical protein [Streptomyces sp. ISL-11]MBT2383390.1 hypothetical protein [Streptomyces sp. ISL-11]